MKNEQEREMKQASAIDVAQRIGSALAIAENKPTSLYVGSVLSGKVSWQRDVQGEYPVVTFGSGLTVVLGSDLSLRRVIVKHDNQFVRTKEKQVASKKNVVEVSRRVMKLLNIGDSFIFDDATLYAANPRDLFPSWMVRWCKQVSGIPVNGQGIGVVIDGSGSNIQAVYNLVRKGDTFKSSNGIIELSSATTIASQSILKKYGVMVNSPSLSKREYVPLAMFQVGGSVARRLDDFPVEYFVSWYFVFSSDRAVFMVWIDAHNGRVLQVDRS